MTTFSQWKQDADMPTVVDGEWVDLETGLPYKPSASTQKSKAQDKYADQIDTAMKASRVAKLQALKGTVAQKKWAIQIRMDRFTSFTNEIAKEYINATCFLDETL
jgi:hypothetical protein